MNQAYKQQPEFNALRKVCRHCRSKFVCKPRGLCWTCYYKPGVKQLYPVRGSGGSYEQNDFVGSKLPLPGASMPVPTRALPGTEEKIRVLARRAANNQCLYHPLDARADGVVVPEEMRTSDRHHKSTGRRNKTQEEYDNE